MIADPNSIFDIMVKRLHEYKRQLLKALHIITLYRRLKADPDAEMVPRTFVFGAKAAPGYFMAKLIIKLINNLADVINNDSDVQGRLRVVFPANFNVSMAEKIYPAADISEQISMAGKEASGTGNMKFRAQWSDHRGNSRWSQRRNPRACRRDNFFLFGLTAEEVLDLKQRGYQPRDYLEANWELMEVIGSISAGDFSGGDKELFKPIVDALLHDDPYLLLVDYPSYIECSEQAAEAYQDQDRWTRMSIRNVARCGFFSSDRSMRQYCDEIWKVQPVALN